MKSKLSLCILLLTLLPLAACSNDATVPNVAPAATATSTANIIQYSLSTATTDPLAGDLEAIEALVPQGEPAEEWNGVPVMPGAIAGDEKDSGYVYSIPATAEEIQEYYEDVLGELGFTLLAVGHGQQEGALLLIFSKESQMQALSLIPYETLNLVLINREN